MFYKQLARSATAVSTLQVRSLHLSQSLGNHCVAVQKPAPEFKGTAVVDNKFKEIKLSDYTGKYLVLFFYPLDL